jgi:hypothetical protein
MKEDLKNTNIINRKPKAIKKKFDGGKLQR